MTFTIKQNDTAPAYVVALKDNFGEASEAAINLTTPVAATAVWFKMREQGSTGAPTINATAVMTTPASGIVTYNWTAGQTGTVGTYDAEFEIRWTGGGTETVPNGDYLTIEIVDDLDA